MEVIIGIFIFVVHKEGRRKVHTQVNLQRFEDVSTFRAMKHRKIASRISKPNGIFCIYMFGIQVLVIAARKIVG